MADIIEKLTAFMKAQQEAERDGEDYFECPICGSFAVWSRAEDNGHLHCACQGCGFRVAE